MRKLIQRIRKCLLKYPVFDKYFADFPLRNMSGENVLAHALDTEANNKRLLEDANENDVNKRQKTEALCSSRKRKKYALLLSYIGANYMGMQRNPGCNTIEENLLVALKKANLIDDKMFEEAQLMSFQRAARTDKGVSAAKQVVSIKLPDEVDKDEINQFLPNDIRLFGIQRVTKSFNSKNFCTARTYIYIIPTYVFTPGDNSFLNEEEYTIHGKRYTEHRILPETLKEVNETMKLFVGSYNCHNVTSKIKPLDPRAFRTIHSFACTETFVSNGLEFAVLTIKGQSFLLHQIRKMVCLLINVLNNVITKSDVLTVFSREKYKIGKAPGLGLILRNLHYDHYDKKYGNDGLHQPLTWDNCETEVEKFLNEGIIKHIIKTECEEQHTFKWLQSKEYHISKPEETEETQPEPEKE